ncbi:pyruvate kinase [Capsulimonas corticalis]|uniref:Pyruvate kinase n=1 Tax=Capsulimonas corticalis TaxID=2219043 RepID=A0A402CY76_9BACT|nr:pyruvate kinase [Capsulimonas corticalis]BDI31426.1 pyruvate kinase [Capsulimonas corticalis]
MRRTKIVCTIGPATSSPDALRQLIIAGMDVARLNFSHGSHEAHAAVISSLRSIAQEMGRPLSLLQDLSGPKVRVGKIAGDGVYLQAGSQIILTMEDVPGDEEKINLPVPEIFETVLPGTHLMLDDGLIELRVKSKRSDALICEVVVSGLLTSHKGVNVPGVSLPIAAVTDKDLEDLHFGIQQKVDWVAASFVRSPTDIAVLRGVCDAARAKIPIIAKIEKHEAITCIDEILEVVDGIMVARGDLGVEVPIDEVPVLQKMLIRKANQAGKPVITATQMLDSMIRNPRPTRAEATDVANAIFDGTDAVMLSGETAVGQYPYDTVRMMAKIATHTEASLDYAKILDEKGTAANSDRISITEAVGEALCDIAQDLHCSAIIAATASGRTARVVSRYRPRAPIIAATNRPETFQRLALIWGVHPVMVDMADDADSMVEICIDAANKSGYVQDGDIVVLSGGVPVGRTGSTNFIKIHRIGQPLRPE